MSCCKVAGSKSDLLRLNNSTLELLLGVLGQKTAATGRLKKVLASEVSVLLKSFGSAGGGAGGDAGGGAGGDNGGDAGGDNGGGAGDDNDDNDDHNDDNDENDGADMQIFVKMHTGKTITLYVEPTDTIDNVKSLIKNMEGIPRCHQRLTLEGLPVNDDDKVIRGATYELLMRLAGGAAKATIAKKQAIADRKLLMSHRHNEALLHARNTLQDTTLFNTIKLKLETLNAKLLERATVIKDMVQEIVSESTLNELKGIISHGSGTGGATTELKVAKMTKYIIGDIYTKTVEYKERCERLIDAMHTMSLSLFNNECYSNDKDTYVLATFKKQLEDRLLIVAHMNLQNITLSLSAMSLAADSQMGLD